jgi:hypothetical protein
MQISRKLALKIIKYLLDNPLFYFPFKIMCKEYISYMDNDDNFVEIVPQDDYENLVENLQYDTFELWENLQNLDLQTLELLSKGFIEKIINENAIDSIEQSAKGYRELWKMNLCESANIEEYGLNEFFGGKAEGFEESLEILKEHISKNHE